MTNDLMKYLWKIGGEAGFGILTTGLSFSKIAARLGYHIFDYIQYPSLIRGGHNGYEVLVSDEPVSSLKNTIDLLVCLNKETFEKNKDRLVAETIVLYDADQFDPEISSVKVSIPFASIIKKLQGQTVMINTITLGASLALLGSDLSILRQIIETQFGKKGKEIVDFNLKFAEEGYNHIKNQFSNICKPILVKKETEEKLVMTGNEAFSLGATIADCRLYVAYPMTPSSSVLTILAGWQEKTGMIVRHAEDEISVINTALGGSFAGVRSAVGTSGGGFALMVEAVSLAGITELPIVIFIAQRPGPATGMPTWTEQGDLLFTVHSGHGEFPKIVLAPGDIEEMVEMTTQAFDLADMYQTPVIVMSDMFLSESHKTIAKEFINNVTVHYKVNRGKLINEFANGKYARYRITDDGISERLIPGCKGQFFQANSYEHLEDGHTTEESQPRKDQVEKRGRKSLTYLKNHFQSPKLYGDMNTADTVFVSWGSMKGPVLEAQKLLKTSGKETGFIHFTYIYPLDSEKVKQIFQPNKRYVLVENNTSAQFGKLLRQETGINIKEKILRYDGRPVTPEEIRDHVTRNM